MDPYQDNQDNAAAGGSRQALFTPEPTVPPEVPIVDAPTQPLHPYLSNHPTQTFNTEAGDIILNTDAPKPKLNIRPFIIGGAILAGVVGVIVVVLLITSHSSGSKDTANTVEAEVKFNQFATYLLNGASDNILPGEYELDKTYTLDLQLESGKFNEEYWSESSELLDSAIASADENKNITRYLIKSLRKYKQYFDFIKSYSQNGKFDEDQLLQSYLRSGAKAANSLVDNFYGKLNDSDFEIAKRYVDNRKEQYSNEIVFYSIYKELGCIQNDKINEDACTRTIPTDTLENLKGIYSTISNSTATANKTIQNAVTYLKSRCWDLSLWLQNPIDERDGGVSNEG